MDALSGETLLVIAVTTVPFLLLELVFFVRFGQWIRHRSHGGES